MNSEKPIIQIKSEMTGTLIEVKVKVGERVSVGQELAIIESMKMEVPIVCLRGGTVLKIFKISGQFVNEAEVLFELG